MTDNQRLRLLKIGAAAVAGLFLLDRVIVTPATASWSAQSDRIHALEQKVQRGHQLLDRQNGIRSRWDQMVRANLPTEVSAAESKAFQAIDRWARTAGVSFSSLTPQWQHYDAGYDTLECRASITGAQPALGRFVYELETDSIPVNLQEFEMTTRDDRGALLTMTARFSILRLDLSEGASR